MNLEQYAEALVRAEVYDPGLLPNGLDPRIASWLVGPEWGDDINEASGRYLLYDLDDGTPDWFTTPEAALKRRRDNLTQLYTYLTSHELKTRFSMHMYAWNPEDDEEFRPQRVENECGTVACLAGHGPIAGIKPASYEDWSSYVRNHLTLGNMKLYSWLFSGDWGDIDNTLPGALARLKTYLDTGIPAEFTTPRRWSRS